MNVNDSETDVTGPPPEVMEFGSLDSLLRSHKNGGLMHLGVDPSIDLYLPTLVPDGYELYDISVSNGTISLSYLPEEYTDSWWSIYEAQIDNKHFHLWYALPNDEIPNTMENLLEQFNADENDLIAGKYLFYRPRSFFWVEEEVLFTISMPISFVTPFASALRDENIDGMEIMSYDGFSEIVSFLRVEPIQ